MCPSSADSLKLSRRRRRIKSKNRNVYKISEKKTTNGRRKMKNRTINTGKRKKKEED